MGKFIKLLLRSWLPPYFILFPVVYFFLVTEFGFYLYFFLFIFTINFIIAVLATKLISKNRKLIFFLAFLVTPIFLQLLNAHFINLTEFYDSYQIFRDGGVTSLGLIYISLIPCIMGLILVIIKTLCEIAASKMETKNG